MIQYREYIAKVDGLEKKVGFLAESHIYTPKEDSFVEDIVRQYDNFAIEGGNWKIPWYVAYSMYIPCLIVATSGGRQLSIPTAENLAEEYGKNIIYIEDNYVPSLRMKIGATLFGIIATILSPVWYPLNKILPEKKSPKLSIIAATDITDCSNRSRFMIPNALKAIRSYNNLLINIGNEHLDEMVQAISAEISLQKVSETII